MHGEPDDPDFMTVAKMYFDDSNMNILMNHERIFLACALHEYGHFVHMTAAQDIADDERKENRAQAISVGGIIDEELLADQFAVQHAGKSAVIALLDDLIRRRRIRNDDAMELAVAEMERRKRVIKNM